MGRIQGPEKVNATCMKTMYAETIGRGFYVKRNLDGSKLITKRFLIICHKHFCNHVGSSAYFIIQMNGQFLVHTTLVCHVCK
jgi:hypothetical protein